MLVQVISVTYEQDVTGYGRKMGRNGGGNGYAMEDPHPYTEVTINQEVLELTGRDYFNYGSQSSYDGEIVPRKTGEGLPWDL